MKEVKCIRSNYGEGEMKTKHGSPEIIHLVITVVYNLEIERSAYPDESSYADICNYELENFSANLEIFTPSEIKAEIRNGLYSAMR